MNPLYWVGIGLIAVGMFFHRDMLVFMGAALCVGVLVGVLVT